MVTHTMLLRVRPVVCVLAIVALFAVVALSGDSSTAPSSGTESSAAVAGAHTATMRHVADLAPKGLPLAALVLVAELASAALLSARHDRLIGRRLRRLRDAGHDWRSLLIGAPPALA